MEKDTHKEEAALGLAAVKIAIVVLAGCVLVLSACYNIYILKQNNELSTMLAKTTFEIDQMRYEREMMNSFVREVEDFAKDYPAVEDIISKYRIMPAGGGRVPGASVQADTARAGRR